MGIVSVADNDPARRHGSGNPEPVKAAPIARSLSTVSMVAVSVVEGLGGTGRSPSSTPMTS